MTKPNELIETIEKALEAATPGKWISESNIAGYGIRANGLQLALCADYEKLPRQQQERNAYLIANAPEMLRALLEENKRLKQQEDENQTMYRRNFVVLESQLQQTREELQEYKDMLEYNQQMCKQIFDNREEVKAERDEAQRLLKNELTQAVFMAKENEMLTNELLSYPPREKGATECT